MVNVVYDRWSDWPQTPKSARYNPTQYARHEIIPSVSDGDTIHLLWMSWIGEYGVVLGPPIHSPLVGLVDVVEHHRNHPG